MGPLHEAVESCQVTVHRPRMVVSWLAWHAVDCRGKKGVPRLRAVRALFYLMINDRFRTGTDKENPTV